MKNSMRCLLVLTLFSIMNGAPRVEAQDNPFAAQIRTTEPLSPSEERAALKLPPGFEIQLFAAEPDIAKPMNMAFDSRGRLWVTVTREYPVPAPSNREGRDALMILEDTDGDGRADRIDTFADGLNIPIGVYPYRDGAVVWSIPNLWFLRDTDGDGRADRREKLYGPLGWELDTHGMNASFRRGLDGWMYATHGYRNETVLRGRDGHEVKLNSGNTYRVRLDGSRAEHHTHGQVNPFGLTWDDWGNLYSADCHSSPVYQLLQGAYYPSFGKPHDGLGFGPVMIQHTHDSTALCGIVHLNQPGWPEAFRDNVLIGNVMTSRVNRDQMIWSGSSPTAKEMPDFLVSKDPWFRPVDQQLGPDGALYIADFYNRIIGHYEVPLDHEGRDRERGRIWRVVYKGAKPPPPMPEKLADWVKELDSPHRTRRWLASDRITDHFGRDAAPAVVAHLNGKTVGVAGWVHGLWVLYRLDTLPWNLVEAGSRQSDARVRAAVQEILCETSDWSAAHRSLALAALSDPDPRVQRAAAAAMGRHPHLEQVMPLTGLVLRMEASADDHLRHVARMALRDQLAGAPVLTSPLARDRPEAEARAWAGVALGVPSASAGAFLLDQAVRWEVESSVLKEWLSHATRYAPQKLLGRLVKVVRDRFGDRPDVQLELYVAAEKGLNQKGETLPPVMRNWGRLLASELLPGEDSPKSVWTYRPSRRNQPAGNPWMLQQRASQDGSEGDGFLCSLPPGGERLTGSLVSPPFTAPERVSFWLAGHRGSPKEAAHELNVVQLRDERSGDVLVRAFPPRHDQAVLVDWDLSGHAGRPVRLELVDGDSGRAYAWLAAGRFSPGIPPLPGVDPRELETRQAGAVRLARTLEDEALDPGLRRMVRGGAASTPLRRSAALSLARRGGGEPKDMLLPPLMAVNGIPAADAEWAAQTLLEHSNVEVEKALETLLLRLPSATHLDLARDWSETAAGSAFLLDRVTSGKLSARLLLDREIRTRLAARGPAWAERIQTLTKGLPEENRDRQALIVDRAARYRREGGVPAKGKELFQVACAACHQVGGQGGLVGPQLDGIGGRGLDRLLEDVLDPGRIVDGAFRVETIVMKNGEVLTVLPRREEGAVLVVADATGQEKPLAKAAIMKRTPARGSLMPDNWAEAIPPEAFNDLLAFLLQQAGSGVRPE